MNLLQRKSIFEANVNTRYRFRREPTERADDEGLGDGQETFTADDGGDTNARLGDFRAIDEVLRWLAASRDVGSARCAMTSSRRSLLRSLDTTMAGRSLDCVRPVEGMGTWQRMTSPRLSDIGEDLVVDVVLVAQPVLVSG